MSIHCVRVAGKINLLGLAKRFPERYPALLESVARGHAQARFDILAAFPSARYEFSLHDDFAAEFDQLWRQHAAASNLAKNQSTDLQHLPFRGGWVVFLSYELAQAFEPRLKLFSPKMITPKMITPIAVALRCRAAVIYDHVLDQTTFLAEAEHSELLEKLRADWVEVQHQDRQIVEQNIKNETSLKIKHIVEDETHQFLAGVQAVRDYIVAGDVFQVNLSRAWRGEFASSTTPADVYLRLRESNPSPFAALFQDLDFALISSSPERLVTSDGKFAQTRPIAGTRPRDLNTDSTADAARVQELISHPKERAEHIMLIDLERNDLGRICKPGSVVVDELMSIESYAHVHHIVSNVRGELLDNITPGQIIRALFPGGTITGCPKVRCMEIISELEADGRGAYTGSLGYVNHDGSMDFNILIRTIAMQGNGFEFRAGAGVVMDSIAENELEETRAKAKGLIRAFRNRDF